MSTIDSFEKRVCRRSSPRLMFDGVFKGDSFIKARLRVHVCVYIHGFSLCICRALPTHFRYYQLVRLDGKH